MWIPNQSPSVTFVRCYLFSVSSRPDASAFTNPVRYRARRHRQKPRFYRVAAYPKPGLRRRSPIGPCGCRKGAETALCDSLDQRDILHCHDQIHHFVSGGEAAPLQRLSRRPPEPPPRDFAPEWFVSWDLPYREISRTAPGPGRSQNYRESPTSAHSRSVLACAGCGKRPGKKEAITRRERAKDFMSVAKNDYQRSNPSSATSRVSRQLEGRSGRSLVLPDRGVVPPSQE